jgi:hypothetical protein
VVIGSAGMRLLAKTGKGKAGRKLRLEREKRGVIIGSAGMRLQAKTGKGKAGCKLRQEKEKREAKAGMGKAEG